MNLKILAIAAVGLALAFGAGLNAPVGPIAGTLAAFVVLPLLASALLEERVTARSLLLGLMLAVVISIGIGWTASVFPADSRSLVARFGFAVSIAAIGIAAARLRRWAWTAEVSSPSKWRLRHSGILVLASAGMFLSLAIATAFATPNKPDPYLALWATAMDGTSLPAVIEGETGSPDSVLVGVRNATGSALQLQVVVSGADPTEPLPFSLDAGSERSLPVGFRFGLGETTLRVELQSHVPGYDRFIVLRLNGT